MKKFSITLIILLSIIVSTRGQVNLTKYYSSLSDEFYKIDISEDKWGIYSLWIDAFSTDEYVSECGMILNQSDHEQFLKDLKNVKSKYNDWIKIAEKNNVTKLNKEIEIDPLEVTGYFYYSDEWETDFSVILKYNFQIINRDGIKRYLLTINGNNLVASSNKFIECDGFIIAFYNSQEINDFIDKISLDMISDYYDQSKEHLFK